MTCDETKVPGSPFAVTAVKGSNPAMVKAYGPGLEKEQILNKIIYKLNSKAFILLIQKTVESGFNA